MSYVPKRDQIPNLLTWTRVVAIPPLLVAAWLPGDMARMTAVGLFMAVALTDWLDGYLARRWQVHSDFGAFLDPVADKLLVAAVLLVLLVQMPGVVMLISVVVIVSREIFVSALREWMAGKGMREQVKVSSLGKWKTTFQMLAILVLLAAQPQSVLANLGQLLLLVAAALTLISLAEYIRGAIRALRLN